MGKTTIEQIREQRTDLSRYLVHWTDETGFRSITNDGYFKPGYGERWVGPMGCERSIPTVRGRFPAVCLMEVPVGNYLQSFDVIPQYRRWCYGIAVPKISLYAYGARPALYGDDAFRERLGQEDKYLFVRFDYSSGRYGCDWTHEREWRVRPNEEVNQTLGVKCREQGWSIVPLFLPDIGQDGVLLDALPEDPQLALIVEQDEEKSELRTRAKESLRATRYSRALYPDMIDYRTNPLSGLLRTQVLSLEEIRDRRDREGLWRLEDFLDSPAI